MHIRTKPLDDPIMAFAEVITSVDAYSSLPASVIAFQQKRLLDNLATAGAGRFAAGLSALENQFDNMGSAPHCLLAGRNRKASLPDAAYFNSVAARALDYCDVLPSGQHPSSTDVPVALAVGAYAGASGQDVLAALATGQDLALRIHSCVKNNADDFHGFDGNILSYFSACAITAYLLRLPKEQILNAFGLTLNMAAGTFLNNRNGSLAVRFVQGFASRGGIEAALLASQGVTGPKQILCGEGGFFDLYSRQRNIDIQSFYHKLGKSHMDGAKETCFKLYPSCSATLSLTDAALRITDQCSFDVSDIDAVHLQISPTQDWLCGAPFNPQEAPEAAALFSVQYVVANALIRKSSKLEHFAPTAIANSPIRALAQSITTDVIALGKADAFDKCHIDVRLKDGRRLNSTAQNGKGWPANPLSNDEFDYKLVQCLEFGGYDRPKKKADMLREAVTALPQATHVDHIMPLLLGDEDIL